MSRLQSAGAEPLARLYSVLSDLRRLALVLNLIALLAGLVLAVALLGGDSQGRVNLLYLLVLFVFWPVLAFVVTLVLLIAGRRGGSSSVLIAFPGWPQNWRKGLALLSRRGVSRAWLFTRSQSMALAFSLGALVGYMLMLLGTDINFVWRSTLLQASDLLQPLRVIATPWTFLEQAQPSLELLQQTRDFRLGDADLQVSIAGQWWRYLLMAQLCYALFPRLVLYCAGRIWLGRRIAAQAVASPLELRGEHFNQEPGQIALPEPATAIEGPWALLSLVTLPPEIRAELERALGVPQREIQRAPLHELEQNPAITTNPEPLVVIVNGREPPLGEFQDFLRASHGYLLPVSIEEGELRSFATHHRDEWRRVAALAPGWQVLQPEGLP